MAKNKVSEWSATPADNTDVGGIDINEGCAPSGINNAIRDVMAQIKDMQTGADGDNFAVGGALSVTGNTTLSSTLTVNSSVGTAGQALLSRGAGLSPQWGAAFVTGMIMLWSGSSGTIPSGWLLCDGSNSTPDLRNRFVVGATSTYAVGATGGSANAVVVSHTHSATVTDPGHTHVSTTTGRLQSANDGPILSVSGGGSSGGTTGTATTGITVANSTEGVSGTNANLPPYYALCYIMKS
jgi:hypothetical protein